MISMAELMDWLKAEPGDEALVRSLEREAVEFVSEPGGRYFGARKEITENHHAYRGGGVLCLGNEPEALVMEEQAPGGEWQAVGVDRYSVSGRLVYLRGVWTSGVLLRGRYMAGYTPDATDPDVWDAPEVIKGVVRMLVAHRYQNREGGDGEEVEAVVQTILRRFA